jgi:hypothetical protein
MFLPHNSTHHEIPITTDRRDVYIIPEYGEARHCTSVLLQVRDKLAAAEYRVYAQGMADKRTL